MLKAGSCDRPAEVVASALLSLGATNLQAKLGKEIASYGGQCWRTDVVLRDVLKRWDGRPYHRESIGRARRLMARRGWIGVKRIFAAQELPSKRPDGRHYRSAHGTTNKHICWAALGVRNPLTKSERKKERKKAEENERKQHDEGFHIPLRTAIPAVEAFLQDTDFEESEPTKTPRGSRREEPAHVVRDRRERMHQGEIEERAAEQRRQLEAWARENEGRGPPE